MARASGSVIAQKLVRADSWVIGGPFKEKPRVKRGLMYPDLQSV
jgi:hypothetical protein